MCFPMTRAPQYNPKAPHAPLCPGWGVHNASLAGAPQERGKEGEGGRGKGIELIMQQWLRPPLGEGEGEGGRGLN